MTDAGVDVPKLNAMPFATETMFSSPRRHQLHKVATTTLLEHHDTEPHMIWGQYKQPLKLVLQAFSSVSDKHENFWYRATPFFERKEYSIGTLLYNRGDRPNGFYLLEDGILKAEYILPQGNFSEVIVAGTTCGELPFFSNTTRTSTTIAEKRCIAWVLTGKEWDRMQSTEPDIARELLKLSLKLTSERMDAITK